MNNIKKWIEKPGVSGSVNDRTLIKITFLACMINVALFSNGVSAIIVDEQAESNGFAVVDSEYLAKAKNDVKKKPTRRTTIKEKMELATHSTANNTASSKMQQPTSSLKRIQKTELINSKLVASTSDNASKLSTKEKISTKVNTIKVNTIPVKTAAKKQVANSVRTTSTDVKRSVTRQTNKTTKHVSANQTKPLSQVAQVKTRTEQEQITPSTVPQPTNTESSSINQEYFFDDSLILGSASTYGGIARFNQKGGIVAGDYEVDVYVNGKYKERQLIHFAEQSDKNIGPCLNKAFFESIEVVKIKEVSATCAPINELIDGAFVHYDPASLRLNISIPQIMLKQYPHGYVDPKTWSAGDSIAFINYSATHSYTSVADNTNSYLSLNSGINLGLWRLRQQGSYTYSDNNGSHWKSIRAYVQRAIPTINSELTLGDSFTSGRFMSGLAFRGLQLASDERMYPASMQGYAPVVRGVAKSNATVLIRQNGNLVYQTTVPAGAFEINDLSPTNYGGDLDVEVIEADGQSSFFSVPFSALPESLREGSKRYSVIVGQARDVGDGDDWFGELSYQYGLNNYITLNTASRIGKDYYSLMLGNTFSSWIGSIGANATYSYAKLPDNNSEKGWMANISYSRTIQTTGTTLTFAGYRYSSKGYRDFADIIGLRDAYENDSTWTSTTYLQRARLEFIVNQSLNRFGQLYISASRQYYRDDRENDSQLQAGYTNNWKSLAYSLRFSRIYNSSTDKNENTVSMSLSMPIGIGVRTPVVTLSGSHYTDHEYNTQANIAGLLDEANTMSYSMNVGYDSYSDDMQWGLTLSKRYPVISLTGNYNNLGGSDWSGSLGMRGALVAHTGGITLGPYVSDTFALIEAKGAEGAKVTGGNDIRINKFGYAIVPSLSPYRYNSITLDSEGMDTNIELKNNSRVIAPYAGAVVKVKFDTIEGYPVLISTKRQGNQPLPLGANVYNQKGVIVGMVGQGSQVYARAEGNKGSLMVKWGEAADEQCTIDYTIRNTNRNESLYRLKGICINASGI